MTDRQRDGVSRRRVLAGGAALIGAAAVPGLLHAAAPGGGLSLRAGPGRARLLGADGPATAVWCYDGRVPGPELRFRQGDRLRVTVENALAEETTVHFHGIRLPNAMDGVPHLTQPPIAPGARFLYEFDLPDAGTYWYHPHQRSPEQVDRGLAGVLVVEEEAPPTVDRDVVWALDDWRLDDGGRIAGDFGSFMDLSHAGRLGNVATINGEDMASFPVRAGERVRLRLVNLANARVFALEFRGHRPVVIALDGHPVEPHEPAGGKVVLGPAMRADLLVDMTGRPGERHEVWDAFYPRQTYKLVELTYGEAPAIRGGPPGDPPRIAANPLPEPSMAEAERHEVVLGGGMMGGMGGAMVHGQMTDTRSMMRRGLAWAINGVAETSHTPPPFLTVARNRSVVLAMRNDTAWHHPMHLHGHAFRVTSRNGRPTAHREWRDTVLVEPRETVEIAFVADNPGDWMFHCHVLEHQAAGMMAVLRVA